MIHHTMRRPVLNTQANWLEYWLVTFLALNSTFHVDVHAQIISPSPAGSNSLDASVPDPLLASTPTPNGSAYKYGYMKLKC